MILINCANGPTVPTTSTVNTGTAGASGPLAVAVNRFVPTDWPSVIVVVARPVASVVADAGLTPTPVPPDVAANVTVTPATGLPRESLACTVNVCDVNTVAGLVAPTCIRVVATDGSAVAVKSAVKAPEAAL